VPSVETSAWSVRQTLLELNGFGNDKKGFRWHRMSTRHSSTLPFTWACWWRRQSGVAGDSDLFSFWLWSLPPLQHNLQAGLAREPSKPSLMGSCSTTDRTRTERPGSDGENFNFARVKRGMAHGAVPLNAAQNE
jgi:hypothetical protein